MPQISLLPAGTTPVGTEYFPAVQGVVTSRFTLNQVYAATKTLTGTTYDTAAAGNSFSINGLAATSNTGTGAVVRAVAPTLGAVAVTSINGITITPSSGTLTLNTNTMALAGAGVNLALVGTGTSTMTFPTTSATIARTDAANTFTGHQTIEGVTSTGATGTGNLVFSASPTFTGTVVAAGITASNQITVTYGSANLTVQDNGTSFAYLQIIGSGGGTPARMRVGSEGTGGGALFAGSSANASVIGTVDNNPFQVFTNNVLRATFNAAGGITVAGNVLSNTATGGIGYATGAGATGTQGTSKSTTTTLTPAAAVCGAVTMNNAALAAATIVSFTLTNASIAVTDVLVLNHISGGTIGAYTLNAQCAAGSATINVRNNTAGSLSDAIVIQFVVIKGVNA